MSDITQLSNEPNHENKFWSQDENTDYTIKRTLSQTLTAYDRDNGPCPFSHS